MAKLVLLVVMAAAYVLGIQAFEGAAQAKLRDIQYLYTHPDTAAASVLSVQQIEQ
jgi:hypothetical protein